MAVNFLCAGRRASLPALFALSVALLFSLPAPVVGREFSTVVIDAGHGGFDRGGIPGQRVPEKIIALDVAQRLEKRLRQAGYRVVMTRDSDVFVPLGERTRIANSYGDAVFVCIHFNSATRAGQLLPNQLGFTGFNWSWKSFWDKEGTVIPFVKEPERTTLTEPPAGLRTPSPKYQYGSKNKLEPTQQTGSDRGAVTTNQ